MSQKQADAANQFALRGTYFEILEHHIMSPNVAKRETELWAKNEIERLRSLLAERDAQLAAERASIANVYAELRIAAGHADSGNLATARDLFSLAFSKLDRITGTTNRQPKESK